MALLKDGEIIAHRTSEANALDFLFTGLEECLAEASASFGEIDGVCYCEGPGSAMGLRIAAMALMTWKTTSPKLCLHACRSLPLHAALFSLTPNAPDTFSLVAQWRKDTWYRFRHSKNDPPDWQTMDVLSDADAEALEGEVFHVRQRKFATQPPSRFQPIPISLAHLPAALRMEGLLRATDQPEFFDPGMPSYKKWVPQRHRGKA